MNVFGIALIVIGVALVCGGLILWLLRQSASRREPPEHDDGLGEMRVIIDALEEADRAAMTNIRPRLDQYR